MSGLNDFTLDNVQVGEYIEAPEGWSHGSFVEIPHFGTLELSRTTYPKLSAVYDTLPNTSKVEEQKINNPTPADNDQFGISVAMSDDGKTIVVGAPGAGTNNVGEAYVYTRSGTTWTLRTTITHPDPDATGAFGNTNCVAISGDGMRIAISDIIKDVDGQANAGATYIFVRTSETVWTKTQTLTASTPSLNSNFGRSLAFTGDGTRIVIGERSFSSGRGRAYFFHRDPAGEHWTLEDTVIGDSQVNEYFGWAADISSDGRKAIIGSYAHDVNGTDRGKAYMFNRWDTSQDWMCFYWNEEQEFIESYDPLDSNYFGYDVSISGDGKVCAIGSYQSNPGRGGVVEIYKQTSTYKEDSGGLLGKWYFVKRIVNPNPISLDAFGRSCQLSKDGKAILIGADGDDSGSGIRGGVVYVYRDNGEDWVLETKVVNPSPVSTDAFGSSVAADGEMSRFVVGNYADVLAGTYDQGAIHVYRNNNTGDMVFSSTKYTDCIRKFLRVK